ncbi:hypothetical protein C8R43DRAFT_1143508 [Mycena crocata]|nr:hypothetical protein C8R43DRAFT_1143508 [Mycena crocata]
MTFQARQVKSFEKRLKEQHPAFPGFRACLLLACEVPEARLVQVPFDFCVDPAVGRARDLWTHAWVQSPDCPIAIVDMARCTREFVCGQFVYTVTFVPMHEQASPAVPLNHNNQVRVVPRNWCGNILVSKSERSDLPGLGRGHALHVLKSDKALAIDVVQRISVVHFYNHPRKITPVPGSRVVGNCLPVSIDVRSDSYRVAVKVASGIRPFAREGIRNSKSRLLVRESRWLVSTVFFSCGSVWILYLGRVRFAFRSAGVRRIKHPYLTCLITVVFSLRIATPPSSSSLLLLVMRLLPHLPKFLSRGRVKPDRVNSPVSVAQMQYGQNPALRYFATRELLHSLLKQWSLLDITDFANSSPEARLLIKEYYNDRIRSALRTYFGDSRPQFIGDMIPFFEKFWLLTESTRSIIIGSFIHFVIDPKARWMPNNLNVSIPEGTYDEWDSLLRGLPGKQPTVLNVPVDSDVTPYLKRRVDYTFNAPYSVAIMEVIGPSSILPVITSPHTSGFRLLTRDLLAIYYPRLAAQCRSLETWRWTPLDHCELMEERGDSKSIDATSWDTPCETACAVRWRFADELDVCAAHLSPCCRHGTRGDPP